MRMNPVSSVSKVPLLGQQQQRMQAAVGQQMQQLSLQIYSRVAGDYLAERAHSDVDQKRLMELAQSSQTASRAYFEAMGVEFQGGDSAAS